MDDALSSNQQSTDWSWLNVFYASAREVGEIAIDDFATIKRRSIDKNEEALRNDSGFNTWLARNVVKNFVQSINKSLENLAELKVEVIKELKRRYPNLEGDWLADCPAVSSSVKSPTLHCGALLELKSEKDVRDDVDLNESVTTDEDLTFENDNTPGSPEVELVEPVDPLELDLNEVTLNVSGEPVDQSNEIGESVENHCDPQDIDNEESFENSPPDIIENSDEEVENDVPMSQSLLSTDINKKVNKCTNANPTSVVVEKPSVKSTQSQDENMDVEEASDIEETLNSVPDNKKDDEQQDSDTTVCNSNKNSTENLASVVTLDSGDEDMFASPVSAEPTKVEKVDESDKDSPVSGSKNSSKPKTSFQDSKDKKRVLMSDSSDDDFKSTPSTRKSKRESTPDKKPSEKNSKKEDGKKNSSLPSKKKSKVSSSEDDDDMPRKTKLQQKPKSTKERRRKVDPTYWKTHDQKDDEKLNQNAQILLERLDPEIEVDLEKKGFIKIQDSSPATGESDSDDDDRRITRAIKNIEKFDPYLKEKSSPKKAITKGRKLRDRTSKEEVNYAATSDGSNDETSDDEKLPVKTVNSKLPKKVVSSDEKSSASSAHSGTDDETARANVLSDSDDSKVTKLKQDRKEKSSKTNESKGPKPNYYTPAVCKLSSSSDDEVSLKKVKKEKVRKQKQSDDESSDDFTTTKRRVLRKRKVSSSGSNNSDRSSKNDSSESDSSFDTKKSKRKTKSKKHSSGDEKASNKKKRRRIKVKNSDNSSDNSKKSDDDSDVQEVDGDKTTESPSKGRKNIRKVLSKKELERATRTAEKEEEERKRRVLDNQKLFNEHCNLAQPESDKVTSLVLDFDKTSKEHSPLVSVDPTVVCKLKPHQARGIKFMYDNTIESVQQIEKNNPGGGCIIAHCMGLGKTLTSVSYVHSILTNEKMKMKTALIICPLNTVGNWYNEFKNWLSDVDTRINIHKLWDQKHIMGRADVLATFMRRGGVGIIHYECFRTLSDLRGQKKLKQSVKDQIYKNLLDPGPDVVICDEGHLLKNDKSKLSISVNKIKTRRRIVLTGTPLQNNLAEYHTMMSFVKPNLLGTLKEFTNRFVNPIKNGQHADSDDYDVKLMKRRAHVLHKLLDGCVQRLDYSVLVPYLPPKYEYVVMIKMVPKQVELYKYYLENIKSRSSQNDLHRTLLKNYALLQKVWTHPIVLTYKTRKQADGSGDESDDSMEDFIVGSDESTSRSSDSDSDIDWVDAHNKKVKKKKGKQEVKEEPKEAPAEPENEAVKELPADWYLNFFKSKSDMMDTELSAKLLVLMEILKICESIGDKLLVFSQYLSSLNLIEEFLDNWDQLAKENARKSSVDFPLQGRWRKNIEYYRIDGGTKTDVRQDQCDKFNKETTTRAKLFLISTRAGGLGINLVGANRVVIFDASWNPSHDQQSVFRVFRFGQTKPCYIYRLLAEGTMEEKIYNRQVVKLSLSGRVVDEHQIERHFKFEETNALYCYEDPDEKVDRPIPPVPKDRLLADLLLSQKERITTYLEHDTLLENKMDEGLTEEERKAAWEEYNNEKVARVSQPNNSGADASTYVKIWSILRQRYNLPPDELKLWSDKVLTQINLMQQHLNYYNMYRNVMTAEEEKMRKTNIENLRLWITNALGTTSNNAQAPAGQGSSANSHLKQQLLMSTNQNFPNPAQRQYPSTAQVPTASVVQNNNAQPYPLINIASNILDTSESSAEAPAVPHNVSSGFSDALNIVQGSRPWTNVVPYTKPTNHEN